MEFCVELWKIMENLITIISHGKDGKGHGKSHGKSWNFLQLKKYEPCPGK